MYKEHVVSLAFVIQLHTTKLFIRQISHIALEIIAFTRVSTEFCDKYLSSSCTLTDVVGVIFKGTVSRKDVQTSCC